MRNVYFNLVLILLMSQFAIAQSKINQFDANGKRDGIWIKYYKVNNNIRYKGRFIHGKEIGVFKYYDIDNDEVPIIIRKFNLNDSFEDVLFFSKKGILQSEGKMQGKLRVGKWVFYHKDGKTVMTEEFYKNGKIDGESKVYYANGKLTEVLHYSNGKLNGNYKRYSILGFLYQDLTYVNGVLNGPAIFYNRKTGKILSKGNFKNNKRLGSWKHYGNGKPINTDKTNFKPKSHN